MKVKIKITVESSPGNGGDDMNYTAQFSRKENGIWIPGVQFPNANLLEHWVDCCLESFNEANANHIEGIYETYGYDTKIIIK